MPMQLKWIALARNTILIGSWFLFVGSLPIFTAYNDFFPSMVAYSWCISAFLFFFFYPFAELGKCLIIVQNFWINGFVLIGLGIYPSFCLPTLLGGILLILGGVLSFIAAAMGETGQKLDKLGEIWQKEGWWKIWNTWLQD